MTVEPIRRCVLTCASRSRRSVSQVGVDSIPSRAAMSWIVFSSDAAYCGARPEILPRLPATSEAIAASAHAITTAETV